jgi:hypothetical protein
LIAVDGIDAEKGDRKRRRTNSDRKKREKAAWMLRTDLILRGKKHMTFT